ncbi:nucleotide exchange factor GrpE [Bacteroidota bacterium]
MTTKEKPKVQAENKTQKTASTKTKSAKSRVKTDSSAKLKELQKELQEQKDKYLRLSADYDNFRKRTLREKIDLTKLAGESIFINILPVLDNLERAMKSIEEAKDVDAVKEGMFLIYNNFKEYLNQQGVKEIDAMHKDFDTDVHEAVTKIPTKDKKLKGKVVDIIEKGYFLNEKVIRYSKVVIGE